MEPKSAAKVDYFLNVLKPTVEAEGTMVPVSRIDTADSFGAEIQAAGNVYRVTFRKDRLEAPQVRLGAGR